MKFSSFVILVDIKNFAGLIKLSIEQEKDGLGMTFELFQIKFNIDEPSIKEKIIDSIRQKCDRDPTNVSAIFSSLSVECKVSEKFNYYQLEDLDNNLSIIDTYTDLNEFKPIVGFKVKGQLAVRDLKRIKRFVSSFLNNYNIISDTVRFAYNQQKQIDEKQQETISKNIETVVEKESSEELDVVSKDSLMTECLKFMSLAPQTLGHLIHLCLNYYRFYDDAFIEKEDRKLIINTPNIFTVNGVYNKIFMSSLFDSLKSISKDKVTLIIKNITNFMYNKSDELKSYHIKTLSYILFIYCVRYIQENYAQWCTKNIDKIITDINTQHKMISTYLPRILNNELGFEIIYKINPITKINDFNLNLDTDDLVDEFSSKFSYVKTISQEKFADMIFSEMSKFKKEKTECEIPQIGVKTILDIKNYFPQSENKNNISKMLITNKNNSLSTKLLFYKKHDKIPGIITEAYYHFQKFLENPISITTIPQNTVPKTVLKTFDVLKNILSDKNLSEKTNSTYYFYSLLEKTFGNKLDFNQMLYIIYQIIIPYQYQIYNMEYFEDSFLNLYSFR